MESDAVSRLPRLTRLRAFDAVFSSGAMNGAASRLHLTQPAVTRAIRALERHLGVTLFARAPHGSLPTEEGRLFGRRTTRFFGQWNEAVAHAVGGHHDASRLARKISDGQMHGLLAIANAGNFRRAAQQLGIAEPTLHRAARSLERLLGIPLFRSAMNGLGLSESGAELARRFAIAAIEIDTARDELDFHRGVAETRISIGVLALAPKSLLMSAAEKMMRQYRRARLTLRESSYDELVEAMRRGEIDAIVGALRAPPPYDDLQEEALFEDPYCVVCRRGHPLTNIARPRRADLRAYEWIFPTAALPRRAVLDKLIADWRLSPRVAIETNSLSALISALTISDRLSLLPRDYVFGEEWSAQLRIVDLPVPHTRRMVGVTTRRDWLPMALHAAFIDSLREASQGRGRPQPSARRSTR